MSSLPQFPTPVNPAELEPAAPKRVMRIVLKPLREDDEHEAPFEVDAEQTIPFLLRQWLDLRQERDFAALRLQRVKALDARAEARLDEFEAFVADRIKSYVVKNKRGGTKYVDLTLDEAGLPDVRVRVGMRAQQDLIEVLDESALIAHYTAKALPTDTRCGPCQLVPASWTVHKTELNEIVKALPAGASLPGVNTYSRDDAVYEKEL